jgi:hypothetical protein
MKPRSALTTALHASPERLKWHKVHPSVSSALQEKAKKIGPPPPVLDAKRGRIAGMGICAAKAVTSVNTIPQLTSPLASDVLLACSHQASPASSVFSAKRVDLQVAKAHRSACCAARVQQASHAASLVLNVLQEHSALKVQQVV